MFLLHNWNVNFIYMELALNLTKLRGTIFTSQIFYSPAFVASLSEVLKNYLPSFLSILPQNNVAPNVIPNGIVPNFWEMVSTETGERIQFNNIKVDIIKNIDIPYSTEIITDFSRHCSDVFNVICSVLGQDSTRLAIAPTFTCVDSDENIKLFAQEIFVKKSFKDSRLDNCIFNNIFRVNEKIGDKKYIVNYLANIYAANRMEIVNGSNTIKETISVDFDINTIVDPTYIFDVKAIMDFFASAPSLCSDYFNFFFK